MATIGMEGGHSRRLEVALSFREQAAYEHTQVTIDGGALHAGDLAAGASYAFAVPLPDDALPTYRSPPGELHRELDVRSDEAGRDPHARHRVEVAAR